MRTIEYPALLASACRVSAWVISATSAHTPEVSDHKRLSFTTLLARMDKLPKPLCLQNPCFEQEYSMARKIIHIAASRKNASVYTLILRTTKVFVLNQGQLFCVASSNTVYKLAA